jgi:hypothetical protein
VGLGGRLSDDLFFMNADTSVKLIEEMMDLKLQQYAESQMRPTPEVARILHEKRETDRRRLDQIRSELARILNP